MSTADLPPSFPSGMNLRPIEENDRTGYGYAYDLDDDYDLDFEDYEPGWGDRFRAFVGRGLIRLGWLGLAAGLALGSAGLVAATEHLPSTGARPELTWGADQAASTKLSDALRDLATLNDYVDALGTQARNVLSSLTQIDQVTLQQAWDDGTNDVNSIVSGAADLNQRLACQTWQATPQSELARTYSAPVIDRYYKVCAAIQSVSPLHDDWQSMVDGSRTAIQVADDIETHDTIAAAALQLYSEGRYADALSQMSGATAAIADATTISNHLALVTPVPTLSQWLVRTKQVDGDLTLLWQLLEASGGVVNSQVAAAFRALDYDKALLPETNQVFGVAMYEMAGNLTSYGISIETARGALSSALAALNGGTVYGM